MILLSPEAIADLERLRRFLEDQHPPAAARTGPAIWAGLARIETFPHLGQRTADPDLRQAVIRFGQRGYVVRYAILRDGTIFVTRVWHACETRD
jgi:toxin ParE1/3/4